LILENDCSLVNYVQKYVHDIKEKEKDKNNEGRPWMWRRQQHVRSREHVIRSKNKKGFN